MTYFNVPDVSCHSLDIGIIRFFPFPILTAYQPPLLFYCHFMVSIDTLFVLRRIKVSVNMSDPYVHKRNVRLNYGREIRLIKIRE